MSNMMRMLTAVVCIGTGAGLLGWSDLFHLAVGLPLLGILALLLGWWRRRMELEEEAGDEGEGPLRPFVDGALLGGLALLPLWGAFAGAAHTPVYGWFYDRDCPALIEKIGILDEGRAYERIIQLVGARRQQKLSSDCRQKLAEARVRARLKWAEQLRGEERFGMLQLAWEEAKEIIEDHDLRELIAAKLRAEEQERLIEGLKKSRLILQTDVLFEHGQADLTAAAWPTLKRVADFLNRDAWGKKVRIEGYTDSSGREEDNQVLSQKRAESVAGALVRYGVGGERLVVRGYGESHPAASNATPAGRAKNRRVEILIQD